MAGKRGKKRQQKKQQQQAALGGALPGDGTNEAADAANAADDGVDDDEEDGDPSPAAVTPPPLLASAAEAGASPAPAPAASPAPVLSPEVLGVVPIELALPGEKNPEDAVAWPKTLAAFLEEQLKLTSAYVYTLIGAVVFCVYANSMGVPFLFDDAPVITRERLFHELSFHNFFQIIEHYKLRLIPTLTFYFNYHIQGTPAYQYGPGPWEGTYGPTWTYHVFNMAIHALNGVLLYLLLKSLLSGPLARPLQRATAARRQAQKSGNPTTPVLEDPVPPLAEWIALGATLFWLVHPIQTMAVTYITQRHALMGALGMFGSLWCYVSLRRRMEAGTAWLRANATRSYAFAAGVFGFWVFGCLSKENAAIVPWVIPLIEWLCFSRTVPQGGKSFLDDLFGERRGRWFLAFALVPFFFMGVFFRYMQVGFEQLLPSSAPTFPDRYSYFRTEWVVTLKYLRLFAMPTDLTVEQAFPGLSWTDPVHAAHMVAALVGHALIATLAVIWYRTGRKFLTLCVAWYYMTLAIESSIIPILDPMVDHRMYVPSAFLCAGLAYGVARSAGSIWTYGPEWANVFSRAFAGALDGFQGRIAGALEPVRTRIFERRHSIAVGFVIGWGTLIVLFAIGTHIRNRAWGNKDYPYRIWEDVIEKRPDCARAYSSLGMELLYKGRWLEAVQPIETALYLGPYHVEGWNNIGKAYLELGSAMPITKDPDPKKASLHKNPLLEFAKETLEQGIEVNRVAPSPSVPLCWNNLGLTYLKMSERLPKTDTAEILSFEREAAASLAEAVKLDPGYETAWINLGTTYVRQAELSPAGSPDRKALALKAVDAIHASRTLQIQHQLFSIAALNCALADRYAEHHAEAFALFHLLVDQEGGASVQTYHREEALYTAEELGVLPAQVAQLGKQVLLTQNPSDKKQLQELLADLDRELKDCRQYAPYLLAAGRRFVAESDKLLAQDPRAALQHLRLGGRLIFFGGDAPEGLAAYDRAIQLATAEDRPKLEKERADLAAQAPPPGPPH